MEILLLSTAFLLGLEPQVEGHSPDTFRRNQAEAGENGQGLLGGSGHHSRLVYVHTSVGTPRVICES